MKTNDQRNFWRTILTDVLDDNQGSRRKMKKPLRPWLHPWLRYRRGGKYWRSPRDDDLPGRPSVSILSLQSHKSESGRKRTTDPVTNRSSTRRWQSVGKGIPRKEIQVPWRGVGKGEVFIPTSNGRGPVKRRRKITGTNEGKVWKLYSNYFPKINL